MTGEHTIEPKQSGLRWDWGWVKQWSFIFIINLGIPFLFGLHYIRDGGAIGLAFGILALWMMGIAAGYLPKKFRNAILIGGIGVAISQVFPIFQIICGSVAIGSWQKLTGLNVDKPDSMIELSIFGVTVLTGQIMIVSSTVAVLILSTIFRQRIPN